MYNGLIIKDQNVQAVKLIYFKLHSTCPYFHLYILSLNTEASANKFNHFSLLLENNFVITLKPFLKYTC